MNATTARNQLYKLIESVNESHKPIQITGKRGNAILLSEEDWNAILETLSLEAIPGMGDSIRKGMKTPVEKCAKELKW